MTKIRISAGKAAVVDKQDADWINQWHWTFSPYHSTVGRAHRRITEPGRTYLVMMHREIWAKHNGPIPRNMVIDHINGDSLDNRLSNLRVCTQAQNIANRHGPQRNNRSGHLGVAKCKQTGRWKAYCSKDGKQYWAGRFSSIEEAVKARKALAESLHGEFAPKG